MAKRTPNPHLSAEAEALGRVMVNVGVLALLQIGSKRMKRKTAAAEHEWKGGAAVYDAMSKVFNEYIRTGKVPT